MAPERTEKLKADKFSHRFGCDPEPLSKSPNATMRDDGEAPVQRDSGLRGRRKVLV